MKEQVQIFWWFFRRYICIKVFRERSKFVNFKFFLKQIWNFQVLQNYFQSIEFLLGLFKYFEESLVERQLVICDKREIDYF